MTTCGCIFLAGLGLSLAGSRCPGGGPLLATATGGACLLLTATAGGGASGGGGDPLPEELPLLDFSVSPSLAMNRLVEVRRANAHEGKWGSSIHMPYSMLLSHGSVQTNQSVVLPYTCIRCLSI